MESFIPQGGFQLPFQRRLSRLYNDTKKSSDFVVKEPVQSADDPEIKALHRKLRIQKDRLVSWGLEWADPNQAAEIDESLSKAGLSDLVGSIMATIKDILAEAEPLWLASKGTPSSGKAPEKATGDRKIPIIVWDKGRFEDLVKDLTASIDTLSDLSRTRSEASGTSRGAAGKLAKSAPSIEDLRPFGSTRLHSPQVINPTTLTLLDSLQAEPLTESTLPTRPQSIAFMNKQAYAELTRRPERQSWSPLLLEYGHFDQIYATTGIMPSMERFEKLSAGLQTESQRSPGAWVGLPLLLGYYEDMESSRLALIYQFPPSFNPVTFENLTQNPLNNLCTLAELLDRPDFEPRLEAKFRLAHNLANTVFDMQARGITHGNLLDSAVSFCNPVGNEMGMPMGEVDIRKPLVSSFDIFPDSYTPDTSSPSFSLHRHPLDPRTTPQSPLASNSETKTLDLYSLAMLLVSIGLWTKLENLVPNPGSPSIPESVLEQLAIRCGTPYMKAVMACWSAVDQELVRPGQSDTIVSQIQVRACRYLEACCILDGVSGLDERLSISEDVFNTTSSRPKAEAPKTQVSELYGESSSKTSDPSIKSPSARPTKISGDEKKQMAEQSSTTGSAKPSKPREKSPKLRLYPQVPQSEETIQQWNEVIMPQINIALKGFYRKHPESVEISLESIGESPENTKPTALVVCTSVGKVKAILNKKIGIFFDGSTGFSLKVCSGSVKRSRKGDVPSDVLTPASDNEPYAQIGAFEDSADNEPAANPEYQERPLNGASIGAWIGYKHLPPVSFGGLILVDDKPYGMTVHHMLDDPDETYASKPGDAAEAKRASVAGLRSSAAAEDMLSLMGGDSSTEGSTSDFACEFSDSDSEFSATDFTSDDEYEDDDDFLEPGDIPGVEPGCGDGYCITQPAFEDVEDGFYPSEETMDEDHLDTYNLGEMYASSGIRRRTEDGLIHEIDWALFEFQDHRLPELNTIPQVKTDNVHAELRSGGHLRPTKVASTKTLPGTMVQCMARTSGLKAGLILPALASVKIYGRMSPSHTYQVSGAASFQPKGGEVAMADKSRSKMALGTPGDSGAWVVNRDNGDLCGHVLAWSARKQVAYISPMDVMLRDIAERLHADDIRLPGGDPVLQGSRRRTLVQEETGDEFSDVGSLEGGSDQGSDTRFKSQYGSRRSRRSRDTSSMQRDDSLERDMKALEAEMSKVNLPGGGR